MCCSNGTKPRASATESSEASFDAAALVFQGSIVEQHLRDGRIGVKKDVVAPHGPWRGSAHSARGGGELWRLPQVLTISLGRD
jgi:hypothetical protein